MHHNGSSRSRIVRAVLLAIALFSSFAVFAQVKVGIIYSATGPLAAVGIPQKAAVPLLPARIGEISVDYVSFDDASDPTETVKLFRKLLTEHRIDALLGPTSSPGILAILPLAAETGTPVITPAGTTLAVRPMDEQRRWIFKTTRNDAILVGQMLDDMQKTGINTLGFLGTNDAYGESWYREIMSQTPATGIRTVVTERFQRTDNSVVAQAARIVAVRPDSVLVVAAGGAAAMAHVALIDAGFKGLVYQTHGAGFQDFITLGGSRIEGARMVSTLVPVIAEVPGGYPTKAPIEQLLGAYSRQGSPSVTATFAAPLYDAGLLLSSAVPEAMRISAPGSPAFRMHLRAALEQLRNVVGTQGIFNMSPEDHCGLDTRGSAIVEMRGGSWRLMQSR